MIIGVVIILLLFLSTYIDVKRQIIPNYIPPLIISLTCLGNKFVLLPALLSGILSMLLLLVPSVIKQDCFGGGDIKLVAALGFYLGFVTTAQAVAIAVTLSYAFIRLTRKKSALPFAPFLTMAFVPTILIARCFI